MNLKLIALLTDFGTRDGYPGIMKGVIYSIASDAQIVDISHEVTPQAVMEGALTLARAVPYFPDGTVFVGVVDPGVGTERRPMAARLGEKYFVLPDNGLISVVLQQARDAGTEFEMVHLDQPRFWLPEVSRSFHGRDIFAPVGAHIASGIPLSKLGSPLMDPVLIEVPQPRKTTTGWVGEIIHMDAFGNLASNLTAEHIKGLQAMVKIAGETLPAIVQAFGDGKPGDLVALLDSSGNLSVCIVNGNAARRLNVKAGEPVEIIFQ